MVGLLFHQSFVDHQHAAIPMPLGISFWRLGEDSDASDARNLSRSGVRVRRNIAKLESEAVVCSAGADGRPLGVLPMTNRFTVLRTGETGVLWCRPD
jgi:hypothetical protein